MASEFVRNIRNVTNVDNFNQNIIEENDIISTIDGKVYLNSKNGLIAVEDTKPLSDSVNAMKKDVTQNKKDIEKWSKKTNQNEENINSMNGNIETLTNDIKSNKQQLKKQSDSLKTYETNQNKNSDKISSLTSSQQTQSENITELLNKVEDLKTTDTGWVELELNEGFTPNPIAQYRIIKREGIKLIELRGAIKGVKENEVTTIAKIPLNENLTNPHHFIQNATKNSRGINFARWTIRKTGELDFEGSSIEKLVGTEWLVIATQFHV